jgi:DNA-nicking Smr family endonuclease
MKYYFDIQLDLHGYTVDEALPKLEELLFSESDQSILIIHGKGSGRLKESVRGFVCHCNFIKGYDFGESLNLPGGDGVIVVYT